MGRKIVISLSDKTVWCDCDDTLVMWGSPKNYPKKDIGRVVEVESPTSPRKSIKLIANDNNINQLKQFKVDGYQIVVWSSGGARWARNVVDALDLLHIVDITAAKPEIVIDDKFCDVWMPNDESIEDHYIKAPAPLQGGNWVKVTGWWEFLPPQHKYWNLHEICKEYYRNTGNMPSDEKQILLMGEIK